MAAMSYTIAASSCVPAVQKVQSRQQTISVKRNAILGDILVGISTILYNCQIYARYYRSNSKAPTILNFIPNQNQTFSAKPTRCTEDDVSRASIEE
jgi:hypothetical protein